jgi:predicted transcriptional regulator
VSILTESFSTAAELKGLTDFMAANPEQGTGAQAFKQAEETVNANIEWRSQNEEVIMEWIAENAQGQLVSKYAEI